MAESSTQITDFKMKNTVYTSPEIDIIEIEMEGGILSGSSTNVEVKDWEDVEI